MSKVKVLSVKEPWATPICLGIKPVENRSRPIHYRGRLLIHTSAQYDTMGRGTNPIQFFTPGQLALFSNELKYKIFHKLLPTSAIIGEVIVTGCVADSKNIFAVPGACHWIMDKAIIYPEPILNVKGSLGLWEYEI